MSHLFAVPIALLLDRALGEPARFHPLAGFGRLADYMEKKTNRPPHYSAASGRLAGGAALFLLTFPVTAIAYALTTGPAWISFGIEIILLYLAIGWSSLAAHGRAVRAALEVNQLEDARQKVGQIVSRDTGAMTEEGVSRAAIESVLENGADAIFAPLFWFAIAGAPGVVFYRLVNTLDAMWGYRNARFIDFGWATARLDDLLNLIPAQLTALSYTLLGGSPLEATTCWRRQGILWESLNAGTVMASGAGALGVTLGGSATYHGAPKERPILGRGRIPDAADIERALGLVNRTTWIWMGAALFIAIGAGGGNA